MKNYWWINLLGACILGLFLQACKGTGAGQSVPDSTGISDTSRLIRQGSDSLETLDKKDGLQSGTLDTGRKAPSDHRAPGQAEIDSITEVKTKAKRGTGGK